MTHESRLFGAFTYTEDQVIMFPKGLRGFDGYTLYVLRKARDMRPIHWLLSVENGGPELALLDPSILVPTYNLETLQISDEMLSDLEANNQEDLVLYAVVSLPGNIHHMSMNLRTPILINFEARIGMQYPSPGVRKQPLRRCIYRDLLRSRPEDKPSMVVTLRKVNETVEIGDEISVQVLEFADGGVRLGIAAPRRINVSRGLFPVTPECENLRANSEMNLNELRGILSVYNVGSEPQASIAAHHPSDAAEAAV